MEKSFRTSMLDYCKLVLGKLHFDKTLFKKEYRKSFEYLEPLEHNKLKKWLREARVEK